MNKFEEYIQRYQGIHDGVDTYLVDTSLDTPRLNSLGKPLFDGSQFGYKFPPYIEQVIEAKGRAITLLDYGCGQAVHTYQILSRHGNKTLLGRLNGMVQCYYCYDPAVKKYNMKPPQGMVFDLSCCADVMEHVPEEYVPMVLTEIGSYTKMDGALIFSISANPARKLFNNGENLHITIKPLEWWINAIQSYIGDKSFLIFHTDDQRLPLGEEDRTKAIIIRYYNSKSFPIWKGEGVEGVEEIK